MSKIQTDFKKQTYLKQQESENLKKESENLKKESENLKKESENLKQQEIKIPIYDNIKNLPTNTDTINDLDLQIVNNLFVSKINIKENVLKEGKELIIISIIFIIFSLPQTDNLLKKHIPITNNYIYNILFKTILFLTFYFLIKHFIFF